MNAPSDIIGQVLAILQHVMNLAIGNPSPQEVAIEGAIQSTDAAFANFTAGQTFGTILLVKQVWAFIFGNRPPVAPVAPVALAAPAVPAAPVVDLRLDQGESTSLFVSIYEYVLIHFNRNLFPLLRLMIATFGYPLDAITNSLNALENSCAAHGLDFYVANHILLYMLRYFAEPNPVLELNAILAQLIPLLEQFIITNRVSARVLAHVIHDMFRQIAVPDVTNVHNQFNGAVNPVRNIIAVLRHLAGLAGLSVDETEIFIATMNLRITSIEDFREQIRNVFADHDDVANREWKTFLLLLWAPFVVDATLRGAATANQAVFDARVAALNADTVADVAAGVVIPAITNVMTDVEIIAALAPIGAHRANQIVANNPRGASPTFALYSAPHGGVGIH